MRIIEKEMDSVKHKAFGKVKVRESKEDCALQKLIREKEQLVKRNENTEEIDERICFALNLKQKNETEKELNKLQEVKMKKGNNAAVFNLREKILGNKKNSNGPSAITNPATGEKVFDATEILRISADYCEDLLRNREPSEGYEEDLRMKQIVHDVRMEEYIDNDVEFSQEIFMKTFNMLKSKSGGKYNFIIKGGQSLHRAL